MSASEEKLRNLCDSGKAQDEGREVECPDSLWELEVSELVELVASVKPAPGGGSVAMIVACLGAALLRKAFAVSLRNDCGLGDGIPRLAATLTELNRWDRALRESADKDTADFESYIQARRLPRATAVEARVREKAVEEAMVRATATPIAAAVSGHSVVSLALRGLELIDNAILSDAVAGARLVNTSVVCLLATAESNLAEIVKSPSHPALSEQLRELARAYAASELELERHTRRRARP
jgi:methenyltetrahydrofolate cyclohydrolase